MKKVININFQGRVIPIEETSYDLLKQYTDSLRNYFANEEGRDEIINDIESRIGELFQERLKNGATCITDDDINTIINNMGRPQDFAEAESESTEKTYAADEQFQSQQTGSSFQGKRLYRDANHKVLGGVCSGIAAYFNIEPIIVRLVFIFSGIGFFAYLLLWAFVPSNNAVQNGVRRRLYRNPDDKIIGGVCGGIANYFNINVWIPRVLFLVPFISFFFRWGHFGPLTFPHFVSFTFSPGAFFLYIILWMVIPEASTTSEKLEMKGEKVDLNSIKNSVKEEIKEVQDRMKKVGKEAKEFVGQKRDQMEPDVTHFARRTRSGFGNVIVFLARSFAYFVIGSVLLSLLVALFFFAAVSVGYSNIKDFVLAGSWENIYAWGTLLFFICIPIIAIITFIIRRIAKIKSSNHLIRYSFIALWILGLFCFISLIASLGHDVRATSNISEEVVSLSNPSVKKLEVVVPDKNSYNNEWFSFEPFENIEGDTAYIPNFRVRIVKAVNDSFKVTIKKMSNGSNRAEANSLASLIQYNVAQKDSLLTIDRGVAINTVNKFRFQRVIVTVAVPVGKQIRINRSVGWGNWIHYPGPINNNEWYDEEWDAELHGWDLGEDYVMKEDGLLYTLNGKPADRGAYNRIYKKSSDNSNDGNDDNGDADDNVNQNNSGGYRYEKTQKTLDSVKKALDIQKQRTIDSLNKVEEKIKLQKQKLQKTEDGTAPKQEAFHSLSSYPSDFIVSI